MRTRELADRAGVNAETLRYYERRGLLDEPPRTPGGYRDYPSTAVEVLRFVKRAQGLGFTLEDVEELLHLNNGGPDDCDAAQERAQARRADLDARIADLQRMRDSLSELIDTCDLPRADRRCPLLEAIERPGQAGDRSEPTSDEISGGVLSAWRRQAVPIDTDEQAVHRSILRAFAATGRAPRTAELDAITHSAGRSTAQVLGTLHDMDAIRFGPDGDVAVAYPFSATPTRHRVRIADRVDVYAMCAIDALGIATMLGQDTVIESADVTSAAPITVTMTGTGSRWNPASAVVFVGAAADCGPSVDCCCDYLNFFTTRADAHDWMEAHPDVPGQILTQAQAEHLGAELFGPLLAD